MISARARRLVAAPSPLVEAHIACARDPFHPERNPAGHVNLGTAENFLAWDLLAPLLDRAGPVPEHLSHYQDLHGIAPLRARIAALLGRVHGVRAGLDELVVAAGSSAILEMLAFALCEAGDGMIVPAPYYTGFDHDLGDRAGVAVLPAPLAGTDGFRLTRGPLEAAHARGVAAGHRPRAVLITSPHNPLGRTLGRDELETALAFGRDHGLEVVFDEIYAGSIHGGDGRHLSGLALAAPGDRVHLVYGFAKDFAASGFKVGVYHGTDPDVLAAMRAQALFHPVSTPGQHLLTGLLADEAAVDAFLAASRERLAAAAAHLARRLAAMDVPMLPPDAGLFAWLDLRSRLPAPGPEGEAALHRALFEGQRLNISPGAAFGCPEPGWFRLCFAKPRAELDEGLDRLDRALRA